MQGSERKFRFGVQVGAAMPAGEWAEQARRAEDIGYDILLMPDHFNPKLLAYGPALMAAAGATTELRIGTFVIDNDFRHPALLANELRTLDLLSGGRLEIGLGAGWQLEDYEKPGIPFDPPGVRVTRLVEAVEILKALFTQDVVNFSGAHYQITEMEGIGPGVQTPHPPLLIGAGGRRMIEFATQEADIVAIAHPARREGGLVPTIEREEVATRVDQIREVAGNRFDQIELNVLVQRVNITEDPESTINDLAEEWQKPVEEIIDSPYALIGPVDAIVEKLIRNREDFGISYYVVFAPHLESFEPVVRRLAGT